MPRLGGCLPGLVLLVIIFGVPVSLRVAGVPAVARLEQKRETMKVFGYTGTSYHKYNVVLKFTPPNPKLADPSTRNSWTDSVSLATTATRATFDRLRVGETVGITYLPFRPSIGKLTDRSLLDLVGEMLAVRDISLGLVLMLAVIVAVALSTRTVANPATRGARRIVYAVCLVTAVVAGWMGYQNPESVPESAVDATAVGRIVQVQRIDRTLFDLSNSQHSSSPLAQPFDVVEVAYATTPLGLEVHAADAVDSGSVRGLTADSTLRIRYAVMSPRSMRIDGGTRTFRAKNARGMIETAAIGLGMLALVGLFLVLFSKRKPKV